MIYTKYTLDKVTAFHFEQKAEAIKILSANDNSNCSTDTSDGNKTSDFTTRVNEWTEVSNSKKKKKKPKATNAEARHQNIPNTREKNLGVAHQTLRIPTRTQILPRDRNHQ